MTRIALATDGNDAWHARALAAAFAALGVTAVRLNLAACGFATDRASGLDLPGFPEALPDAVLVRGIAGGSFEEVTRRLGVLHALRALGVPVLNDARAIERCVDKSATSFLLARAGLPTPPTWTVEGIARAREIAAAAAASGEALVLKPLFGAQGRGLRLVAGPVDLPPPEAVAGVYYLQRYLHPAPDGGGFHDHRLFVCAGEIVAAMTRRSAGWITNVKQGGRPEPLRPEAGMAELALRAAAAVGADYAGVDVMRDAHGALWVLEVNSMPAWRGLQQVTEVQVALRLAAAVLARAR